LIASRGAIGVCDQRFEHDPVSHPDEDPPVGEFGVVYNPFDKTPYLIEMGEGMQLNGAEIPLSEGRTIVFYPDGHVFGVDLSIELTLADGRRTITVSESTGRVVVN
jgi:hypothetical protein